MAGDGAAPPGVRKVALRNEEALAQEKRVVLRGREAVRAAVTHLDSAICQIVRLVSRTAPGSTASAVVFSEQVAPTLPAPAVAVQGTVNAKGTSVTVPASFCPGRSGGP